MNDLYTIISASIWGAATSTPIWNLGMAAAPDRMERYYGISSIDGSLTDEIHGVLYAFENFVETPQPADTETTCIILGLQPLNGSEISYYRVNVCLDGESQNLVRNNVYRLRLISVDGEGAANEYDAWTQSTGNLISVSIDPWGMDDNGLIITDGVSTLVMPTRLTYIVPEGAVHEYTVATYGPGDALSISKNMLPAGITAILNGSQLTITATAMSPEETQRRGSIELSFAGLHGTITVIQSPSSGLYLDLNQYEVPVYDWNGIAGTPTPFEVSASGTWTATIYNILQTGNDPANPGFSFVSSGIQTTLLSANNPGNNFQIYTTGSNPSNANERNSFMIISLDADPENFNRTVVLVQRPATEVVISPMPDQAVFSTAGVPQGVTGATAETGYVFNIQPGMSGGVPNNWDVTMSGMDAQYFYVEKTVTEGAEQQFTLWARGTNTPSTYPANPNTHINLTAGTLDATVEITFDGRDTPISIPVQQLPIAISLSTLSTTVPADGGTIPGVTVNIDPSLNWTATITDQFVSANYPAIAHNGYLWVGGTEVADPAGPYPQSTLLSAGFDQLTYPMVGETPTITIRVAIAEAPTVYADLTVTQQPFGPAAGSTLNVLDMRNGGFGSLNTGYNASYLSYLTSTALFGPSGISPTPTVKITSLSTVDSTIPTLDAMSTYQYMHVGGAPNTPAYYSQVRFNAVNAYWQKYKGERPVIIGGNNSAAGQNNIYANSTVGATYTRTTHLTTVGYNYLRPSPNSTTTARVSSDASVMSTAVYRYLLKDGPFGVNDLTTYTIQEYATSTISAIDLNGLPSSGIPIIVDGDNLSALLLVDPENGLVFIGDMFMFSSSPYISATAFLSAANLAAGPPYGTQNGMSVFLGNLLAYILNCAQYGSAFQDLFIPENVDKYNAIYGMPE